VNPRALVIGASGQVGQHVAEALRERGWDVTGTFASRPGAGLRRLDVLDDEAIASCVREVRPDVCVLSAALTNVDGCEEEPARAEAANARAPGVFADSCRAIGARVVLLSTEYVFDGTAGPYSEGDAPSPINVYGRTKLEGEARVLAADPRNLAVRTTVVFSHDPGGSNFVMQLLGRLSAGRTYRHGSRGSPSPRRS